MITRRPRLGAEDRAEPVGGRPGALPHFGFRADDIDGDHEHLVGAGMETSEPPQRRGFARMYTSFLTEQGGVEVHLVKYDERPLTCSGR